MNKMTKSTKVILCVVAATLLVCAGIIAVSVGIHHKNNPAPTQTQPTSSSIPYSVYDNTTAPDPTATTGQDLSQLILGKWTDSAGMSGYEFFTGGRVTVTYFNLTVPVINLPLSGTANGTYTLSGDVLRVTFSIYTKTINYTYIASVSDNQLTLRNTEKGDVSTYMRGASQNTVVTQVSDVDDELTGTWVSSDASMRFDFGGEGLVTMAFAAAEMEGKKISGTFTGLYETNGDRLTIEFLYNAERMSPTYRYSVTTKALTLEDTRGNTIVFLRDGITALPADTGTAEDLLGKWRDSLGASGYQFLDGGIVEITYVDITIPVVNIPINGSFRGTYEVQDNQLTLRYSAYTRTVTERFTFSVSGNTLTLTDLDDGDVSTYTRA